MSLILTASIKYYELEYGEECYQVLDEQFEEPRFFYLSGPVGDDICGADVEDEELLLTLKTAYSNQLYDLERKEV